MSIDIGISSYTEGSEIWRAQLRERHFDTEYTHETLVFKQYMAPGNVDATALNVALDKYVSERIGVPLGYVVALDQQRNTFGVTEYTQSSGQAPFAFVKITHNGLVLECFDANEGQVIWDLISKLVQPPSPDKRYLNYLVMTKQEGLELNRIEVPDWADIVPENYPGADIAGLEAMCLDKTPAGRLAVLHGPPGTGKTSLIRGLVARLGHKVKFVIVSADLAATATGPEMLSLLVECRNDQPFVLIVEDADSLLRKRATSDRAGFAGLSAILNASDGIVGTICDIRVICTMNTDHKDNNDIDAAALRVGRCAVNMFLDEFEPQQAVARIAQLAERTPKWLTAWGITPKLVGKVTLAAIYAIVRTLSGKP
jgi:hypothetical protein